MAAPLQNTGANLQPPGAMWGADTLQSASLEIIPIIAHQHVIYTIYIKRVTLTRQNLKIKFVLNADNCSIVANVQTVIMH